MSLFWIIMGVIGILATLTLLFFLAIYFYQSYKEYKDQKRADAAYEKSMAEAATEPVKQGYDEAILNDALQRLQQLVGLKTLKAEVEELVKLIRYDIEEEQFDHQKSALHMVFLGNPGTGKTSVARIIADIYKGLGVLDKGHLVEVDRGGLVAQYIGHTAKQTKEKIEEAFGGILFIDEAYNLVGRGNQDFGVEAVDTLLKMMEDHRGKFIVIVAGYDELMMNFLTSNPGLKSRFDKLFNFEDHGTSELITVCTEQFEKEGKVLSTEAHAIIEQYISHLSEQRQNGFGNAREIRKIVNEVLKNQKLRLAELPKADRTEPLKSTIELADVLEFKEVEVKYRKLIGYTN